MEEEEIELKTQGIEQSTQKIQGMFECTTAKTACKTCTDNKSEIAALNGKIIDLSKQLQNISSENKNDKPGSSSITEQRMSHKIDQILKSYQSSFTMHGLAFIIKGKPLEKVSWGIFTLGVLTLASFMTHHYMTRYLKKDIRTEIRYIDKQVINLPSITLYIENANVNDIFLCHYGKFYDFDEDTITTCNGSLDFQYHVKNATFNSSSGYALVNGNGNFEVRGRGKNLYFQINAEDSDEDDKLNVIFNTAEELKNRKRESFVSQFKFNKELFSGHYEIFVEKEIYERLPAPYESNCTSSGKTIFSDVYDASSCEEECLFNKVFDTCGNVPDGWKSLLQTPATPLEGQEFARQVACISKTMIDALNGNVELLCDCPPSCYEVSYKASIKHIKDLEIGKWKIYVGYAASRRVTSIKQVPDYTLGDFLGAMGGFVGLCAGASILSVIELLVYIILYTTSKLIRMSERRNVVREEVG